MVKTSEETKEIYAAIFAASKEIENPPANTENPFFKSKYTPLDYLITHIKPALIKNGLCIMQSADLAEGDTIIYTRLLHTSGQWVETRTGVPAGVDAQKTGAAITYARRYALTSFFNICSDPDNDGNETVDKLSTMPADIRQLFINKGYKSREAVKTACEACDYDWQLIKKNLEK